MFVMGIDPGLTRCGYGVVERAPGTTRSGMRAVAAGVITTPADDPVPRRLAALHAEVRALLCEYRPSVVAVERVLFQTNARTAMAVGQASGLALAAAAEIGAEVVQYSPNEVKVAVTGYGAATKSQVQTMVQAMLELAELPRPPDMADALALAICHLGRAPLARRAALAETASLRRTVRNGGPR
ncbi:MAG: crossover junction endodeoxyribonuclease RuvC [Acidimicrobiales bacterium]